MKTTLLRLIAFVATCSVASVVIAGPSPAYFDNAQKARQSAETQARTAKTDDKALAATEAAKKATTDHAAAKSVEASTTAKVAN